MADGSQRVVLVTGASGGLGAPLVADLLAHGFIVAGAARSLKTLPKRDGFFPIEADLLRPEGPREAVERTLAATGRIDALVHALGGFAGGENVEKTDDATWQRMMDLNLGAAFRVFREVLPQFRQRGHGRLVAIGSRAAVEPQPTLSAYSVSKAGLVALVRTIALEVAGTDVTANVVLPSTIDTPSNRASDPRADTSGWVTPTSIASLVRWLISDDAKDVNGAVVPIYGGA
jgi:NAD(P)-dependent dehydrogenase (short-subunit alcohol dehydrogenase family)